MSAAERQQTNDFDARQQLEQALGRMPDLIVGNALCLDFANTVEPRGGLRPSPSPAEQARANWRDYLRDYDDVILWALLVGFVTDETATNLLRKIAEAPDEATVLFERAIALREAIYAVFWQIAHGDAPAADDLAVLQREYVAALAAATLQRDGENFRWTLPDQDALELPLRKVALSAVELLTTADPARIKSCPGVPGNPMACAWLFHDTSKNRSRHWCTIQDCGGVTKARRLTERRRKQRTHSI